MPKWKEVTVKGRLTPAMVIDAGNGVELLLTESDLRFLSNEVWATAFDKKKDDDGGVLIAMRNRPRPA